MSENEKDEARWKREAIAHAAAQSAAQVAWWRRRVAGQGEEILRQSNLMYGGLIGVGMIMVQPFLTVGPEGLDLTARICVVAFSLSIPMLAALVVLNRQEVYRRRAVKSRFVLSMRAMAFAAGFVGVVAGFWHMLPLAGAGILISGVVAMFIHAAGFIRLETDDAQAVQKEGRSGGEDGTA